MHVKTNWVLVYDTGHLFPFLVAAAHGLETPGQLLHTQTQDASRLVPRLELSPNRNCHSRLADLAVVASVAVDGQPTPESAAVLPLNNALTDMLAPSNSVLDPTQCGSTHATKKARVRKRELA